jgi:hypothetical protein
MKMSDTNSVVAIALRNIEDKFEAHNIIYNVGGLNRNEDKGPIKGFVVETELFCREGGYPYFNIINANTNNVSKDIIHEFELSKDQVFCCDFEEESCCTWNCAGGLNFKEFKVINVSDIDEVDIATKIYITYTMLNFLSVNYNLCFDSVN